MLELYVRETPPIVMVVDGLRSQYSIGLVCIEDLQKGYVIVEVVLSYLWVSIFYILPICMC